MTYAPVQNRARYQSYQEYLDDESLSSECNYRLLSTGELIEVTSENDLNVRIAFRLLVRLLQIEDGKYSERIRNGTREMQVPPVGDKWVNRKPDLMVLQPEHLGPSLQSVLLEMVPPLFVAEVVSPGGENSDNYQRDYVWKRQQYEEMGIPEYWIMDPHREKVTVLTLLDGTYVEAVYVDDAPIISKVFPALLVTAQALLRGDLQ